MPGLLFILAISLVVGKGLLGVIAGIALTTWVGVCRTIRAEVMKHADRAYVQAAKTLGYSGFRIMFRHILPNVAHMILIQFSIRLDGGLYFLPRYWRSGRTELGHHDQQCTAPTVARRLVGNDLHDPGDLRPRACL